MNRTATTSSSTAAAWRDRRTLLRLVLSFTALAIVLIGYTQFLAFNETRQGAVLADPVLASLPTADLSIPIFAVIYGAIALAFVTLARHPERLIRTLHAYTLLMLVRIAAMYAAPLAPPPGMIALHDPVAGLGPGAQLRQDLFFSGHTATLALLALAAVRPALRWAFTLAALAVAFMVLVQHCHYTVDVLAAPFFAYGCYRIATARGGPHPLR